MHRSYMLHAVVAIAMTAAHASAEVDWEKGWVTAEAIGIANRTAPTPAAARGPARRQAEELAKQQLGPQLAKLPLAAGGTLATKLANTDTKGAIDRAIANAIVIAAEPETDGSWRVTMAVPIEAVRTALVGPRVLSRDAAADPAGPAVVVVESAGARPAVGYTFGKLAPATIFVKDVPAWAKDAPRLRAKSGKAGVVDVATGKATAATVFVVVTR